MFYVCAGAWFSDFSVGAASSLEFIKTKALFYSVSEGRNTQCPTSVVSTDQKRTAQILRSSHVYSIDNLVAA